MTGSRAEKRPNISKVFQERRLALGQRYELARTALLNVLQDEEVEPGADFIAVASERSGLAEDDVHYTFLSIKRKGEIVQQEDDRFIVPNGRAEDSDA